MKSVKKIEHNEIINDKLSFWKYHYDDTKLQYLWIYYNFFIIKMKNAKNMI